MEASDRYHPQFITNLILCRSHQVVISLEALTKNDSACNGTLGTPTFPVPGAIKHLPTDLILSMTHSLAFLSYIVK